LLDAAFDLACEQGSARVTVDAITRRAKAGRQTIYRWWPSRECLMLDALLDRTLAATPMPATANVRQDFTDHLLSVIDLFASPAGAVIKDVVGQAQRTPAIAVDFETRFWAPRRRVSLARLQQAVDAHEVAPVEHPHLLLDALYGPLWLRLLLTRQPTSGDEAQALVALLMPEPS
jgi:AcrR family transcriptional regulator